MGSCSNEECENCGNKDQEDTLNALACDSCGIGMCHMGADTECGQCEEINNEE